MKYKTEIEISKKESKDLVSYAKIINKINNKMMAIGDT